MQDAGLLAPLCGFVKETVVRMTSHGSGHEYGVTLDELLAELEGLGFRNIGGGVQADLKRQVARILSSPVNGIMMFEQHQGVDGTVRYKPADTGAYYEFPSYPMGTSQVTREYDQPIPDTIDGLMAEVKRLKAAKIAATKRQQHLLACYQLLNNPGQLAEETKRLEGAILSMRDMQAMVDNRINKLVDVLKASLSSP